MNALSPATREMLSALDRNARTPLARTLTSPPAIYHSEEILKLEMQNIFEKDWMCPGLAADIPEVGDYITFSIGSQPVYCVRGRDGEIRTFSNICLHRMMVLLEGKGKIRRAVCPYHSWTYDLEGKLIGAGHMERTDNFHKKDLCLPQIRTEIWNGWIYITLNNETPSLAGRLSELDKLVGRYSVANYIPVLNQDHIWNTNWKLLVENFLEGYHGPSVHKSTVGAGFTLESTEFAEIAHEAFSYHMFARDESAIYGRAHQDNKRLEGRWRNTTVLSQVYPTHLVSLTPEYVWFLSLRPHGTGQVQVRIGVALEPALFASIPDKQAYLDPLADYFNRANAEDRVVVEGIYRGALGPLARSGPLCWLERQIHDFMGYLARRLVPAASLAEGRPASRRSAL